MNLVVFSHLRWDLVYQRPQHLLSRLARHHAVTYIEQPVRSDGPAHLEVLKPARNLQVLRPRTPVAAAGFHDDQIAHVEPLIREHLDALGVSDFTAWFYDPMALPLIADLSTSAIVYDCIDDLATLRGAPRQMAQREGALLRRADLVLTSGPSLYESRRRANPYVLCLPNAIDQRGLRTRARLSRSCWDDTAEVVRQTLETRVRQAQTQQLFDNGRRAGDAGHRVA